MLLLTSRMSLKAQSSIFIDPAPDEPYGGGVPGTDFSVANPLTTGQVMKLIVGPLVGTDSSTDPASLTLPTITHVHDETVTRRLALMEEVSRTVRVKTDGDGNIYLACSDTDAEPFGPTEAHLGILSANGTPTSLSRSARRLQKM